uniref:hypothetical protein n=1 Tax=Azospirillum argentinense TaxID=2970906 RepID=UPI0010BF7DF2|nr:hypothetical protein [Azospirillum argentinense]
MENTNTKRAAYREQLPKKNFDHASSWFAVVAGLASILSLFVSPVWFPQDWVGVVYAVSVVSLLLASLFYIIIREQQKLHRYAQAVLHLHYACHIARDYVAELYLGQDPSLDELLSNIASSLANCFTLITGKHCRVSIKELQKQGDDNKFLVAVVKEDILSSKRRSVAMRPMSLHEFTSLKNIFYGLDGCSRYYLRNNLIREWRIHKYHNGAFSIVGEPEIRTFLGFSKVVGWKLPFKSTLAVPIRFQYGDGIKYETTPENKPSLQGHVQDDYWGFVCVDCESSRAFDRRYCPDLASAYADVLYTVLSQAKSHMASHRRLIAFPARVD